MSRIKLEGHENGTGTVTITAPNTNTDRAITIPDEGGAILTNGGALGVSDSAPDDSLNIDSSGNVGIGTASPSSALDVTGKVTADDLALSDANPTIQMFETDVTDLSTNMVGVAGSLYIQTTNDAATSLTNRIRVNHSTGDISFYEDTGTTAKFFWDASAERLTIGTYGAPQNSSADLHIRSSIPFIELTDTDGGYGRFYVSNGNMLFDADHGNTQSDTYMVFRVDDSERMRIDSSGNVGIGGNNPSATGKLTVYNSGSISAFYAENTVSGEVLNVWRMPGTGTQTCASLQNNGGSTVCGTIQVSGSSAYYNTSSDYRLKENVVDMDGAIDRVKALSPKRFNWIADEDDTTVDGFLAHEVSDIVPEAISGEKDATDDEGNAIYQGIDQSKLVPLLTAAIKEQQTIIDDLKTRIETLENA